MIEMGPDRYPPIPSSDWTEEQRRYAQPLIDGPRGAVISPFVPLLRSPELMDRVQATGEYLRYRSAIGVRLTELAILVTARQWDQPVEWAIHAPIALNNGVSRALVEAIAADRRPDFEDEAAEIVHDATIALLRHRRLPDSLHDRALAAFGEQGVVDLLGIVGYYTMLSVVMNGAQTEVPRTDAPPLADLGR
ncbi:carboxymuconolactone decarboxylase family protein [Pelagibacterium montanilacus]|uniref:carboxymuconolactone decarboxylase family protein n=1 Tax=Pelagibacterium montanilacus TaxID=2185280 RepID=UPI000F8C457C|nr:carboxymuconolactone decarboxylase family protein [Pelagibacterium montanilacus]